MKKRDLVLLLLVLLCLSGLLGPLLARVLGSMAGEREGDSALRGLLSESGSTR